MQNGLSYGRLRKSSNDRCTIRRVSKSDEITGCEQSRLEMELNGTPEGTPERVVRAFRGKNTPAAIAKLQPWVTGERSGLNHWTGQRKGLAQIVRTAPRLEALLSELNFAGYRHHLSITFIVKNTICLIGYGPCFPYLRTLRRVFNGLM